MKALEILFVSILFLINSFKSFSQSNALEEIKDFGMNPGNLELFIHFPPPENYDSTGKKALVVALHGCNQNAGDISEESGWNTLADAYNFIVIYPQQKILNNPNRCFNWFMKGDNRIDKGEVASVDAMIKYVAKNYSIDTSRIFIYGLSAGAAMSMATISCYPDLFKAAAILAGGPYMMLNNPAKAMSMMNNPKKFTDQELLESVLVQHKNEIRKRPKIIVLHGDDDPLVNPRNAELIVRQWTLVHETDTIPDQIENSFNNHPDVKRISFFNENKAEVVTYYKMKNLKHQLPVDPGTEKGKGGKTGLFTADKDFFSTWWIAKDFQLVK